MAPARFGDFALYDMIGQGGMAEVFAAAIISESRDQARGNYALKRIRAEFAHDAAFREAFAVEQRLATLLKHPHIVPVLRTGEVARIPYILMQRIDGHTLSALLDGRPWPTALAVVVMADIAAALTAAHTLQLPSGERVTVVHRDLSPSNVIVQSGGQVMLCDFGIARAKGISQTTLGARAPKGKYAYMSPEQVRNLDISSASDVFSLATLVCEMVTGRHPFRAKNEWLTMQAVARATPPPELVDVAPHWLSTLMHDMWAIDPLARPSAADVSARIDTHAPVATRTRAALCGRAKQAGRQTNSDTTR